MSNSILTIDMITRKALEILENNLVITRNVNRQYDDSFAVEGAKIGSTLRIRLPDRALVTDGAALQVQDDNEQFTTLTVSTQKHIGVNFTSAELTMQLDDFAERVLKPRISQLASSIDADVAGSFSSVYNSVGTPGTTPSTSLVLLQAQQKLNEFATPMAPRYATVNPAANAGLVEGMKGLFNPTSTISRQFKNGMMGDVTAILYLSKDHPKEDGTTIYDQDGERSCVLYSKFNRMVVFDSELAHSRNIFENFGKGDESRLIQVAFLKSQP